MGVVAAMLVGPDACSIFAPADLALAFDFLTVTATAWPFVDALVMPVPFLILVIDGRTVPAATVPAGGCPGPGRSSDPTVITSSSILGFM